ncbi:DUF3301 domain-containing protein [Alkalilimnicola ehrlichii MLHE-1]|uniref:DUF3301 domain-containing protein n=1 Tax=Alkalilimnicola ehrlichii (strain ATCC BAA-1101 / DSM 17681 / MLHE-1) TaxID=187272 RepID=Q0AAU7_ALKEH|nr:DUF3301 domain-containing protein [Alkalilimnicola ehrlichii]ABI56040.1 hypothetical protein Mlg_0686 [Alkalilimnicola ehrlichii MLHE-1]
METALVTLLIVVAVGLYWSDALRARDQAVRAARRACRGLDVQLLDVTVSLARIRPARGPSGRLTWRREYRFEFSVDGADRRPGYVQLLGRQCRGVQLDMPEGRTVMGPDQRPRAPAQPSDG